MLRDVTDRYLPPDHDAFVAAEPATGRIIVIAPTRAACETIELAMGLNLDTFLEREHGDEVRALADSGSGFGIVAGTGTGKTLAIRPITERILGTGELRVGVVNREREATPETPTWNVIIVTTGIARRWFQDDDILATDTLVVDEIHQTSAELELCLALGKRVGCRFIWLSATVDPGFYARYLASSAVVESYAFDPAKAATVRVINEKPLRFLSDRFLQHVSRRRLGVAVFLPTRAGVEEAAQHVTARFPRINAAFYHGGEPIRVIRPFLEGTERKPFMLAMTAAGQSAINIRGLDTVVIDDTRFANVIEGGKNVLTRVHLGSNEILQMAGRVHGRVEGGHVYILSDRDIEFERLRPTEPDFQLAGDSERVAMTCADLGVRADDLDLPIPLDRAAYRDALELLASRGIIDGASGRLTRYGKLVEAMPVDRPWAELLVHAEDDLMPFVSVMSAIESLHRMTRDDRDLEGLVLAGSDHLTAYNVYAEGFTRAGYIGEVYGLPRHLFDDRVDEWAERRGVLVKAVEDAALGMASVYRSAGLPLPDRMHRADDGVQRRFAELLGRFMPFDLVIDEETAEGDHARVSKTSVCGSWGPIAGSLRYFADRFGVPRAAIEGTQIPADIIRRNATRSEPELVHVAGSRRIPLAIRHRVEYFGFELERELEPIDEFPPELADAARRVLADALAREEARHGSVKRNHQVIEQVREVYRRSGGATPRLGLAELTRLYQEMLTGVDSLDDYRAAELRIDPDAIVPREQRERYLALPGAVEIRDRTIALDYEVEESDGSREGVARLRLPEKVARNLGDEEIPTLDRPIRFVVHRGQRGSVRAGTLDELRDLLDQPWTEDELARTQQSRDARGDRPRGRGQAKGKGRGRGRGKGKGAGTGKRRESGGARGRAKGRGRRR
ncbi:MAG: DEAD/DEAH box helicase [Gemmatimonadaceae bacterium]